MRYNHKTKNLYDSFIKSGDEATYGHVDDDLNFTILKLLLEFFGKSAHFYFEFFGILKYPLYLASFIFE